MRASIRHDVRGAALIEFVIAFLPMLMVFFSFAQAAQLAKAKLLLKHAAIAATRAAVVIKDKDTGGTTNPGDNGEETDITWAANLALGTYVTDGNFDAASADCERPDTSDPFGLVTCTVRTTYHCDVPLGKLLVCGGGTMDLSEHMSLPFQGARYR
jgi:Flp pilus assembly protein TadG